ncbi:hypothetical protein [Thiomonas sp.]
MKLTSAIRLTPSRLRHAKKLWRAFFAAALLANLQGCSYSPLLHQPVDTASVPANIFGAAAKLTGIDTGPPGKPQVVIFFDPFCPLCRTLYAELRPNLRKVRIHWVPIGTQMPMVVINDGTAERVPASFSASSCLLSGFPGTTALQKALTERHQVLCSDPTDWAAQAIERNTQALTSWKLYGVPVALVGAQKRPVFGAAQISNIVLSFH